MAVPGLDHAREILAGFDLPAGIVVHSEGVRRVAAEAARLVRKAGIPIDVRLVEVAALLHDIDKLQMGFSELAIPVASHPLRCLLDAERYPIGWPSVLVSLADKHVGQGFMTIDERLDEMIERYPQHRGEIGSARRPAHALEQELAEAIDLTTDEVLERLQAAWQAGATTP
jgi:putative nucleotidyltransferase with HDIG domain